MDGMPYPNIPHQRLPKSGTVAYLLAHAQALAAASIFEGHAAAYTVFCYLCCHPAEQMPGGMAEAKTYHGWAPRVAYPHWKSTTIEANTPLHRTTVEKALNWLDEMRLVRVDELEPGERLRRRSGGKKLAKNRKRGEVEILSTCAYNENERLRLLARQQPSYLESYRSDAIGSI
jgi:hypothetical protein